MTVLFLETGKTGSALRVAGQATCDSAPSPRGAARAGGGAGRGGARSAAPGTGGGAGRLREVSQRPWVLARVPEEAERDAREFLEGRAPARGRRGGAGRLRAAREAGRGA